MVSTVQESTACRLERLEQRRYAISVIIRERWAFLGKSVLFFLKWHSFSTSPQNLRCLGFNVFLYIIGTVFANIEALAIFGSDLKNLVENPNIFWHRVAYVLKREEELLSIFDFRQSPQILPAFQAETFTLVFGRFTCIYINQNA